MKIVVDVFRFLLFLPISFLVMSLVNWGLGKLILWILGLSKLWLFIILFVLGGTIWGVFKMIAAGLVALANYISPYKLLGALTISILALLNGGILAYQIWTIKPDYSGWEIFVAIMATLLDLELTFALMAGSTVPFDD